MKPKVTYIHTWECEHKRRYPTAPHKRIYARPKTLTVIAPPKKSALERILEA